MPRVSGASPESTHLNTLLHALIVLLDLCPPLLRRAVAGSAATLAERLGLRSAQTTRRNLAQCYPDLSPAECSALTRAVIGHSILLMFDTASAWLREPQAALTQIRVVFGEAEVDAARQARRPIIFLLPHLGNWELLNHYLGTRYGLTHMYQPARNRWLDRFVQNRRNRTGTRFVTAGRTGVRAQLEALRAGGCIGTMADQEPPVHDGVFAPFFGVPSWTGTLAPALARKTGAEVFVAWCERQADDRYAVHFLAVDRGEQTAAGLNRAIESAVRSCPVQYVWSYKRFRTRPPGEAAFYPTPTVPFSAARGVLARMGASLAGLSPRPLTRGLARTIAVGMWLLGTRFRRQSLANTHLCLAAIRPDWETIARNSWTSTGLGIADTLWVWGANPSELRSAGAEAVVQAVTGVVPGPGGVLLLAPRLGQRELVIRAMAEHAPSSEIYQPFPRPNIDALIRAQRAASGVRLLQYTRHGFDEAAAALRAGEHVIICPEQQPRLSDGTFVSFFGEPALMASGLRRLISETKCHVVLAWSEPDGERFRANAELITLPDDDAAILDVCTAALERAVLTAPRQYRWHDKRFNIRPRGARRLY